MMRLSIGFRLMLWYVAIFAAAELVFGIGMWFVLRQNLRSIADHALQDQVEDLTQFLKAQKRDATIAKLQEEVSEAYVLEHSGDYLQIYHGNGEWLYRSTFLQQHPVTPVEPESLAEAVTQDRQLGDKPFRFLTQQVAVNGHTYTVQTGLPATQILQTLALFRRYLVMLSPILLLAAAAGGYWLSRRALSPVDAITQTARKISGTTLHNLRLKKLTTGDELQRLSDTLNQMLDRLEDAFQRITQFTADASHELRTPISLIRTEAEITLRRSRGDEQYREALRHILLEAERTTTLVDKLLSLARADSGSESLNLRQVDLGAITEEIGESWHPVVTARGLQFRQVATARPVQVMADPLALQRLLAILLDNALKYTPSPGLIELSLEQEDDRAILRVRDSGIGIAPEDQPRIFERFYRVDKARSREASGAGLGLAIAQWIAQQHGGVIRVQSSPGNGTTFAVELPRLATTSKQQSTVASVAGAVDACASPKSPSDLSSTGILHEGNLPKAAWPLDDGFSGDPARKDEHAAKVIGSPYVRSLLPRILLAPASGGWRLLPGLPALRRRVQVRLEEHAAYRAPGSQQAESSGYRERPPEPRPRPQTHMGSSRPTAEAGHAGSLSRQESRKLV